MRETAEGAALKRPDAVFAQHCDRTIRSFAASKPCISQILLEVDPMDRVAISSAIISKHIWVNSFESGKTFGEPKNEGAAAQQLPQGEPGRPTIRVVYVTGHSI